MNTKIKKSLALILTLCMIFSLMPTFTIGALAEGEVDYTMDFTTPTYASVPNWLGTNVYPEREDCSGTGWSWDVSEKKLTLNGLNFTTSAAYGVLLPGGSVIEVASGSTNNITCLTPIKEDSYGICVSEKYSSAVSPNWSLTIGGSGTLNITSGNVATTSNNQTCSSCAIMVSPGSYGNTNSIYITDSVILNATAGTASSSGYCALSAGISTGISNVETIAKVTITDHAQVTAIGKTTSPAGSMASRSCGVNAGYLEVTGNATLTATAGDVTGANSSYDSAGIYADHLFSTDDSAVVHATGAQASKSYGVICRGFNAAGSSKIYATAGQSNEGASSASIGLSSGYQSPATMSGRAMLWSTGYTKSNSFSGTKNFDTVTATGSTDYNAQTLEAAHVPNSPKSVTSVMIGAGENKSGWTDCLTSCMTSAPGVSAFTIELVPQNTNMHRTNAAIDAGDSITYNIVLTQTGVGQEASLTNAGAVQTLDIDLGYDANLTYVSDEETAYTPTGSSTAGTYAGLAITHDSDNHTLSIMGNNTAYKFDATDGEPVVLGTVTFTTPNAATINNSGESAGIGENGAYPVAASTVASGSMVAVGGAQNGILPTVADKAVTVYDIAAHYPAFSHFTMTKKIGEADATAVTSGETVHYTLNELETGVTVAMTADTGYSINAFSLNNSASGTTATGTIPSTATGDVTITGSVTADAQTITYDVDGGTTLANGSYTIEDTAKTLPIPVKTGYDFTGWTVTTAPTGGTFTINTFENKATAQTATLASAYGPVTLKATWTAAEHTDNILPTKPATTTDPESPKTGDTVTLTVTPDTAYKITAISVTDNKGVSGSAVTLYSDSACTRTVSAFDSATAVTVYYKQPTTSVKVTATQTPIDYTITYNSDGGSTVTAGSYNIESATYTLPTAPEKEGYTFAGWKVTSAGSQLAGATTTTAYFALNDEYVAATTSVTLEKAYGAVTLTAQWTAATHTDNDYDDDDPDGDTKQTKPVSGDPAVPTSPETGEVVGITVTPHAGYYLDALTVTDAHSANVTLYSDEGCTTAYVHTDAPTSSAAVTVYFKQPTTKATVNATYTPIEYALNWNGGYTGAPAVTGGSATYNIKTGDLTLPTEPTRTGYSFAG